MNRNSLRNNGKFSAFSVMNVKSFVAGFLLRGGFNKKEINDVKKLILFRKLCHSEYVFQAKSEEHTLEKVLVVFRHGARAPLRNISKTWKHHECISCDFENSIIHNCREKECSNGDLTRNGFGQMVSLGRFIKRNYLPLLSNNGISSKNLKIRTTRIQRTQASAAGVVKGLIGDVVLKGVNVPMENDSLLSDFGDTVARNKHSQPNFFEKICIGGKHTKPRSGLKPQDTFDHYYTSICNGVGIDCRELDCNENRIEAYVKAAENSWAYMMNELRDSESRRSMFGRFANELLVDIEKEEKIFLYSTHDSSISAVLGGLDAGITELPPFAAALFIEIWRSGGERYVRLAFNNRTVSLDGVLTEYIPIKDFVKIILDVASFHDVIQEKD